MMKNLIRFQSIHDYHKFANLRAPEHPLVSLIDYTDIRYPDNVEQIKWTQDYYVIGLKKDIPYKFFYGQQAYDFDQGVMTFIAPNQVMSLANNPNREAHPSGWLLLIHPDFLWNSPLGKAMPGYEFFGYAINESLFLSEREENMVVELLKSIQSEYQSRIDKFSEKIIQSQIELLLNYAERFYERQFITRKITNAGIAAQLEEALELLFDPDRMDSKGIPSVTDLAQILHLSPNYLSSLLKSVTGASTQQHIHRKLIEKAKQQLSSSTASVSEIAYQLGFDHVASFSKLFKNKTEMTPLEFRKSFN